MSKEDCQMVSFSTTWLRLLRQLFELFLECLDSKSAENYVDVA